MLNEAFATIFRLILLEENELAGPQSPTKISDAGNDEALIPPKTPTSLKAPTLPLILSTKDFFTKFMKAFVESTQA